MKDTHSLYAKFLSPKPRKGDLRKAQIIEAAIDCLATEGIDRLTYESVGKKIGLERPHVAYYFKNLDSLVHTAIVVCATNAQEITIQAASAAKSLTERAHAFVDAPFDWLEQYPKQGPVILLLFYLAGFKKEYCDLNTKMRQLGRARIQEGLQTSKDIAAHIQALITNAVLEAGTCDLSKSEIKTLRLHTKKEVQKCLDF